MGVAERMILQGDCRTWLRRFPANHFDAVVTDPPYDLGFMGKDWDKTGVGFDPATWTAVMRVMKPGAHLLSFGGTRTYHRMASAVEDAGFEVRDMIQWLYGTGFPKSLDVGKAIDKAAGKERKVVGPSATHSRGVNTAFPKRPGETTVEESGRSMRQDVLMLTAPATPEATQWDGWGTALKPACEPIILARKPLIGTVAKNVLEWETGGLNIDGARIGYQSESDQASAIPQGRATAKSGALAGGTQNDRERGEFEARNDQGRWPANVIMDEEAGAMLDEQTGDRGGGFGIRGGSPNGKGIYGKSFPRGSMKTIGYGDSGGPSRFFYNAKSSKAERNAGLDSTNFHPTVKPLSLMRYLIRLITPPSGRVLDPFAGSGSTGIAATLEGMSFVGIELDPEFVKLARARIKHWKSLNEG